MSDPPHREASLPESRNPYLESEDAARAAVTRSSYDRFAPAFANRYYGTRALDAEMDGFLDLLPPNPLILDAGCGPGHHSRYFSSCGAVAVALDFSESMLIEGRKRDPSVSLVRGDLTSLPIASGRIDGVWARASLIHMTDAEVSVALAECRRILKPGGILYTAVRQGEGEIVRRERQQDVEMMRYFRFWRLEEWNDLLQRSGFRSAASGLEAGDPEDWVWSLAVAISVMGARHSNP